MKPFACVRVIQLTNYRKVTPGRDRYMYVTSEGIAMEPKDGEDAVILFAWNEIRQVVLAEESGTKGVALAQEFGT